MKTASKKSAKKNASRPAAKRFKEGQSVTYDGKKFTVSKAYEYKGGNFAIITSEKHGRKQVSQNSLS